MQIRTSLKLVWLGAAFLSEEFHGLIRAVPVSLQPVHALYYSPTDTVGNPIVGAITDEGDKNKCVNAATPPWPHYHSPRPYGYGGEKLQWFYSEASLESVKRVQLCVHEGFCVGLRLQYEKFDKTLGHYSLDKESAECFDEPQWGCFTEQRDSAGNSHVKISFSRHMPKNTDWNIFRMDGVMCWWFGPGRSEITVVSQ